MANMLLGQESALDSRLSYLLVNGRSLTRPVFAARLHQIAQQLPLLSSEATLLRRPVLAHNINAVLAQLTEQRIVDCQVVLDTVAQSLSLPWTTLIPTGPTPSSAIASLLSTDQQWGRARWSLVKEPGLVVLAPTGTSNALVNLATGLAPLESSATLALTRGIGIAAVSVSPAPLPAPVGELLLPPVGTVHLGIAVSNGAFVDQPVSVTVTFSPSNVSLPRQTQRMTTTLGPLQSYAFIPKLLVTSAGEKATLTISITGAPSAPQMTRSRTYHVVLSPSGNG